MKKLTGFPLLLSVFLAFPVSSFADAARSYQVDAIAADNLVQAERELVAILEHDPNDPYALLNLAYVYQIQGNQAGAQEVYRRILALSNDPYAELASGRAERVKSIARRGMARSTID